MTNLLEETLETLEVFGKTEHDVEWVANGESWITWDDWKKIANTINYNNGFGTNYVRLDLIIVGKDWWLERHEYDGSEWWEIKAYPMRPNIKCEEQFENMDKEFYKDRHLFN